jgi:putative ATP-dependent endonuclease of the OLD family
MHISKVCLVNFRNFATAKLIFRKGINTIIGENGSGKTNIFRAIRLLLDDNMIRFANKLDERDFNRGLKKWQGHWIIISLEFEEVSQDESVQALFLHGTGNVAAGFIGKATYNLIFRPNAEIRRRLSQLVPGDQAALATLQNSITIDDYETVFTGRSEADFADEACYKQVVGDFENVVFNKELDVPELGARVPGLLSLSKEISFTFIQALRDVVAEFQNNRTNPLFTLLRAKSGDIDPALFQPIADKVKELNTSISMLPDVQKVRDDITGTIKDAAGATYSPTSLSIQSELSDEAEKLFQSLRLFVGESEKGYEGGIQELSLGGANLIFLTLKLLEFKYQKAKLSVANFLLIEEPEAHIHTHIQKTLFDKINYPDTQIIYSTHSTHISEVCNVQAMNILGKHGGRCETYQPSTGLDPIRIRNIQRYLDAVRSNLLFAKSVMLIEGDAEEILIPVLVKRVLGVSLDELGISVINIRSTGFENVAALFHDLRIRKKCSIVTDLDAAIVDTTPNAADDEPTALFKARAKRSAEAGLRRETSLKAYSHGNAWLNLCFAKHTFEVDFVAAGNAQTVANTITDLYTDPATIALAQAELMSEDVAVYGRRVLTMAANTGKGWFAVLVGNNVNHNAVIPNYIVDAIFFGAGMSDELWG